LPVVEQRAGDHLKPARLEEGGQPFGRGQVRDVLQQEDVGIERIESRGNFAEAAVLDFTGARAGSRTLV
jgi:hypothetical protein